MKINIEERGDATVAEFTWDGKTYRLAIVGTGELRTAIIFDWAQSIVDGDMYESPKKTRTPKSEAAIKGR